MQSLNQSSDANSESKMKLREVLVVDDDDSARTILEIGLSKQECVAVSACDFNSTVSVLRDHPDVFAAFIDQQIGKNSEAGLQILDFMVKEYPEIPVIMYTSHEPQHATEALERGAFWYVNKDDAINHYFPQILLSAARTYELTKNFNREQADRARFLALVDCFPEAVLVKDPDGRAILRNKQAREWDENQGCDFGASLKDAIDELFQSVLSTGNPQTRLVPSVESASPIYVAAAAIRDERGNVKNIVEIYRDLSRSFSIQNLVQEISELQQAPNTEVLDKVVSWLVDEGLFRRARAYLVDNEAGIDSISCVAHAGMHCGFASDRATFLRSAPGQDTLWNRRGAGVRHKDEFGDVFSQPEWLEIESDGIPAEWRLEIPFFVNGKLLGVITADQKGTNGDQIDWYDTFIANWLSRHLTQWFESRQIIDERQRKAKENADWLRYMQGCLMESRKPQELFDATVSLIQKKLDCGPVQIHTMEDEKVIQMIAGTDHDASCHMRIEGTDTTVGLNAKALKKGDLFIEDCSFDSEYRAFWNRYGEKLRRNCETCKERPESVAVLPYKFGDHDGGTLFIAFPKKHVFDEEEKDLLREIRDIIALCVAVVERLAVFEAAAIDAQIREDLSFVGAGIAHEINGPNFANHQAANLLLNDSLADDDKELLQTIVDNTERIGEIVDALKRIGDPTSRAETGQPIDIGSLVSAVLRIQRSRMRDKRIAVKLEIPKSIPSGYSDGNVLKLVVDNLIRNAIDAIIESGRPGEIRITARLVDHSLELSVEDTGKGISESARRNIFKPFYTTRAPTGKGIGLTLVQRSLQAIQGRIMVVSPFGQGTRFVVTIPNWVDNDE